MYTYRETGTRGGCWITSPYEHLVDPRCGTLVAWGRPNLVCFPLFVEVGVSEVRNAITIGAGGSGTWWD